MRCAKVSTATKVATISSKISTAISNTFCILNEFTTIKVVPKRSWALYLKSSVYILIPNFSSLGLAKAIALYGLSNFTTAFFWTGAVLYQPPSSERYCSSCSLMNRSTSPEPSSTSQKSSLVALASCAKIIFNGLNPSVVGLPASVLGILPTRYKTSPNLSSKLSIFWGGFHPSGIITGTLPSGTLSHKSASINRSTADLVITRYG